VAGDEVLDLGMLRVESGHALGDLGTADVEVDVTLEIDAELVSTVEEMATGVRPGIGIGRRTYRTPASAAS
jgi:hypothetical protein